MWPNAQETADLVIFTEEILNGKLHFLCSAVTVILKVMWRAKLIRFMLIKWYMLEKVQKAEFLNF